MSLFADRPKWSSLFEDGHDSSLRSDTSNTGHFRSRHDGPRSTADNSNGDDFEDFFISTRRQSFEPMSTSDRIFDQFDSVIRDLIVFDRSGLGLDNVDRQGQLSKWKKQPFQHSLQPNVRDNHKPKEFVIPINIEAASVDHGGVYCLQEVKKETSESLGFTPSRQNYDDGSQSSGIIQIPIRRESFNHRPATLKSVPPVAFGCYKIPPACVFTSTTVRDKQYSPDRSTQGILSRDHNKPKESLPGCSRPSSIAQVVPLSEVSSETTDLRILKLVEEIEEQERIFLSLQPTANHPCPDEEDDRSVTRAKVSTSSPSREESSRRCDVKDDERKLDGDNKSREREVRDLDRGGDQNGRAQSLTCRHSGAGKSMVTPVPSYPIYDLLKPWLASTGRQVDYIRGDGNCFFRALSKELYGSEDYHVEWREAICDLIEAHPHVFSPFVDGSSVGRHVRDMRRQGTWATSCEIYGAATLLRREVYVLAPSPSAEEKEYLWLLFDPCSLSRGSQGKGGDGGGGGSGGKGQRKEEEEEEGVLPCYLTLCLTNGNHYDRITPAVAGVCNCQMAPPCLNGPTVLLEDCPLGWEEVEGVKEEEEEEEWRSKRRLPWRGH